MKNILRTKLLGIILFILMNLIFFNKNYKIGTVSKTSGSKEVIFS